MRSMVFLLVLAALACDDGSGGPNDGNLAGLGGMSGAAAGGGSGSGAGGVPGTSGSGGMVAGGSGGAAGMAGGTAGTSGSGGMVAGGSGGAAGMMEPTCIAPMTGGQPQPTFAWIFENVVPGCAGPPCHSSVAGGGLVFGASKDDAYAQLMMPAMGMNHGCVDQHDELRGHQAEARRTERCRRESALCQAAHRQGSALWQSHAARQRAVRANARGDPHVDRLRREEQLSAWAPCTASIPM